MVLIASKGFYINWGSYKSKFVLLPPVPDYFEQKNIKIKNTTPYLIFGYSGALYTEMLSSFEKLASIFSTAGHKLFIIGNNEKINYLKNKYPEVIYYRELISTTEESNNFLVENCDAYIIPYPSSIEEMPWIKTCFPSKFIQVTQLGLPIAAFAPQSSALGEWCKAKEWILFADNYNESTIINLCEKVMLSSAKRQTEKLAQSEFNPKLIHQQFIDIVTKQIANA